MQYSAHERSASRGQRNLLPTTTTACIRQRILSPYIKSPPQSNPSKYPFGYKVQKPFWLQGANTLLVTRCKNSKMSVSSTCAWAFVAYTPTSNKVGPPQGHLHHTSGCTCSRKGSTRLPGPAIPLSQPRLTLAFLGLSTFKVGRCSTFSSLAATDPTLGVCACRAAHSRPTMACSLISQPSLVHTWHASALPVGSYQACVRAACWSTPGMRQSCLLVHTRHASALPVGPHQACV